jgi:hypothetical protein
VHESSTERSVKNPGICRRLDLSREGMGTSMDERPTLLRIAVLSRLLANALGELEMEENELLVEELNALCQQAENDLAQPTRPTPKLHVA